MANYLNYDDQGFIIGTKRLEGNIKSISDDTQEIIQILKSQNQINQTVLTRIARASERTANKKSMRVQGVVPTYDPTKTDSKPSNTNSAIKSDNTAQVSQPAELRDTKNKITSNATVSTVGNDGLGLNGSQTEVKRIGDTKASKEKTDLAQSQPMISATKPKDPKAANNANNVSTKSKTKGPNNPTGKNGRQKNSNTDKDRNEKGQFTKKEKSLFESMVKTARSGRSGYGYGNTQDVDPLIASVNEVKDAAAPVVDLATRVGKIGGMAGKAIFKRAGKFSFSRYKSLKRKEPLPKEQQRHNKQNEETLGEILKRMGSSSGSSSILGSIGRGLGFFGKGAKGARGAKGLKGLLKGSKGLKALGRTKVLGPLATAIGVGSLASQWGELDHKGKSAGVGSLAGGGAGAVIGGAIGTALIPIPVAGTAVGAAVGGWLGSEGGEVLGETASPYIKSWTDSIKAYNLPKRIENQWSTNIAPFFGKLSSLADRMGNWVSQKISSAGDVLGDVQSTAEAIADAAGFGGLGSVAAKYESSGRGVGTISGGVGDHGGVSYGVHQLASNNGSMDRYLQSKEGQPFAKYFAGTKAGTKEFNERYKQVVKNQGEAFKKSQHAYITRTHYMPAKAIAEKYGFDTSDRGIQEAIYSHATQYGANHTSRFKRVANSGVDMSDNEAVLKALYADKYNRVDSDFKSSSQAVRDGVRKRIKKEQADVLALSKVSTAKNKAKDLVDQVKDKVSDKVDDIKDIFNNDDKEPASNQPANKTGNSDIKPNDLANNLTGNSGSGLLDAFRSLGEGYEFGGRPTLNYDRIAPQISKVMAPATQASGINLPSILLRNIPNIPDMPSFKIPLTNSGRDKPVIVQSNNESIGQNVSDRDLAHAITGGIGMNRGWD